MRGEGAVALTYIGDGGSNVGDFHEGLNMASVMRLPMVLVLENNQFAYSTPVERQTAAERFADRGRGYGIPGVTIDGTDLLAVLRVTREAVERARRGEGPTLIESVTMRMHGHSASDDASYVPPGLLEEWGKKDPIRRFEASLRAERILDDAVIAGIEQRIGDEVEEAVREAERAPYPEGPEARKGVFAL
jgi:TPP-dependent pyruvate/acetoin dehydrogenase alpha subunit